MMTSQSRIGGEEHVSMQFGMLRGDEIVNDKKKEMLVIN